MFNPQIAKEQNDKINAELMALPEYTFIKGCVIAIREMEAEIEACEKNISKECGVIAEMQLGIDTVKAEIKIKLEDMEAISGFSKAPGLAHLTTIAANYQAIDNNAVPPEFIVQKITSSVDKVKLNKAIKSGELDPAQSNWLEVRPEYKTLVLEK